MSRFKIVDDAKKCTEGALLIARCTRIPEQTGPQEISLGGTVLIQITETLVRFCTIEEHILHTRRSTGAG